MARMAPMASGVEFELVGAGVAVAVSAVGDAEVGPVAGTAGVEVRSGPSVGMPDGAGVECWQAASETRLRIEATSKNLRDIRNLLR